MCVAPSKPNHQATRSTRVISTRMCGGCGDSRVIAWRRTRAVPDNTGESQSFYGPETGRFPYTNNSIPTSKSIKNLFPLKHQTWRVKLSIRYLLVVPLLELVRIIKIKFFPPFVSAPDHSGSVAFVLNLHSRRSSHHMSAHVLISLLTIYFSISLLPSTYIFVTCCPRAHPTRDILPTFRLGLLLLFVEISRRLSTRRNIIHRLLWPTEVS